MLRLVKGKNAGYIPPMYSLFRAAKYLGVPPWELERQSPLWINHAIEYESIENEAQEELRKRAEKAAKRRRGK